MNRFRFYPLCFVFLALVAGTAVAQRDYMTEEEIEIVRDSQDIDLRIEVLTKMIDRRLTALGIDHGGWKNAGKEDPKWGPLPKGSRAELLTDTRRLLEKAVDDIEAIADRDDRALDQNKTGGKLFPKAVHMLDAAGQRYAAIFKKLLDGNTEERERGILLNSIELCDQINAAAKTIPKPKK